MLIALMLATTTAMVFATNRVPEHTNVAVSARGQPEVNDVYQYTQEMSGVVENIASVAVLTTIEIEPVGVAILTAAEIGPVNAKGGRKVRDVDKGINLYLNTNTDKRNALCTKTTRLARCIEDRWQKI